MSEPDFVTENQMLRARKIVRKLCYRNTIEGAEPGEYGHLNPTRPARGFIGIDGHRTLTIVFEDFSIDSEELEKIENMDELKEKDSVSLRDSGLKIYLYPEGDEDE